MCSIGHASSVFWVGRVNPVLIVLSERERSMNGSIICDVTLLRFEDGVGCPAWVFSPRPLLLFLRLLETLCGRLFLCFIFDTELISTVRSAFGSRVDFTCFWSGCIAASLFFFFRFRPLPPLFPRLVFLLRILFFFFLVTVSFAARESSSSHGGRMSVVFSAPTSRWGRVMTTRRTHLCSAIECRNDLM